MTDPVRHSRTFTGPAGSVTYTPGQPGQPGQLTVTGDVPWLVTHPKNVAVTDALYAGGHLDALDAYLRELYREGREWELATRRLQNAGETGGPRSTLGDLIVMHGPYVAGQRMTSLLAGMVDLVEVNALRDELITLREIATGGGA